MSTGQHRTASPATAQIMRSLPSCTPAVRDHPAIGLPMPDRWSDRRMSAYRVHCGEDVRRESSLVSPGGVRR
ncbi:hypothetical protein CKY47_29765 [Saccharothrix yanglingensis]|uniref:Uncharacterized protein n=1 Tax=Saccharothrix yanglingensis TaxID=659496 RepID=A0ABU0XBM5_9PSEU|nr:hypothetical protein [Saccharothrix yanglingensis]